MSGNGYYKKLVCGSESKERRELSSRAREKEDAKTAAGSAVPGYRKKVKKKRLVRADHRHVYEEVLVRTTDEKTGERSYAIEGFCRVCGKKDERYKPTGFWKDRLWKSRIDGGRRVYSERSEEEILEICSGMRIIEMTEP